MSTLVVTDIQWGTVWSRPDFNLPIHYGVDCGIGNGVKYYQSWATYPACDEQKRLTSSVYEACDAADPHYEGSHLPILAVRERITADAAAARALMRRDQASPLDMETRAEQLHQKAVNLYLEAQKAEVEAEKRRVEDDKALQSARYWLRGLALLVESGSDEEKHLLQRLLGRAK